MCLYLGNLVFFFPFLNNDVTTEYFKRSGNLPTVKGLFEIYAEGLPRNFPQGFQILFVIPW